MAKTRKNSRRLAPQRPAAQAKSEPDYRALVEAAGDLIYTLDLEGRITFVNHAVEQMVGHTVASVIGRKFTDFLTPESAQVALRHFGRGLVGAETTPFFEVEAPRKSGGTVQMEIRAGNLFKEDVLVGRQGVARDISELKLLQSQVAEKSQRVTLLEERTRIAQGLYARIASLVHEDAGDPVLSHEALRQVHETVQRVSAEKIGLSAGDLKILHCLAKGQSNTEIAKEAFRSTHTIKDHITKIMQRLGVKRRAEAVAAALNLGLISLDPMPPNRG